LKNKYKQLGLDELREKFVNKKACGGGSNEPLTLEQKKDFVTHQAFVKQQSKDSNLAKAIHQKEVKKKMCNATLDLQPTCCTTCPTS
jgi:hypothetical protein